MATSTKARLLTIGEAAARLGVHVNTLRRWADNGTIKAVRLPSGYRRFEEAEINRKRWEMGHRDRPAYRTDKRRGMEAIARGEMTPLVARLIATSEAIRRGRPPFTESTADIVRQSHEERDDSISP